MLRNSNISLFKDKWNTLGEEYQRTQITLFVKNAKLARLILLINFCCIPLCFFLTQNVLLLLSPIIITYIVIVHYFLFFKLSCPRCGGKLSLQESYLGGIPFASLLNRDLSFSPNVCKECGFLLQQAVQKAELESD